MPMLNPPHPCEIIKDALPEIPMSVTQFAKHIGVSRVTLSRVISQRAGITPEMSIRLSEAFGQVQPGDIWFRMQNTHDFWQAAHSKKRKKVRPLKMKTQMPKAA